MKVDYVSAYYNKICVKNHEWFANLFIVYSEIFNLTLMVARKALRKTAGWFSGYIGEEHAENFVGYFLYIATKFACFAILYFDMNKTFHNFTRVLYRVN